MRSGIISQQLVVLEMGEFLPWLADGLLEGEKRSMLLLEVFLLLVDQLVLVFVVDVRILLALFLLFLHVVIVCAGL